eukprot:6753559-Ditylum_brightwellii.AAC.1
MPTVDRLHEPDMTCSNDRNEICIWNGHQPSCQEPRRVENNDDCSLTSIESDYDDDFSLSSSGLSEEEANEILLSLDDSDIFEDQINLLCAEGQPLEYRRNAPHKEEQINGLACAFEKVHKDNFDLTEEDTELIEKAANVFRNKWGWRRDQRLLCKDDPSFTEFTERSGINA